MTSTCRPSTNRCPISTKGTGLVGGQGDVGGVSLVAGEHTMSALKVEIIWLEDSVVRFAYPEVSAFSGSLVSLQIGGWGWEAGSESESLPSTLCKSC